MNAATLREHLQRLDTALRDPARLCVYGSAAVMLLGEEDRFSLDVDIAGPYSSADEASLAVAAQQVGLPVNPDEAFAGDHIEWVGALRLCLRSRLGWCVTSPWRRRPVQGEGHQAGGSSRPAKRPSPGNVG